MRPADLAARVGRLLVVVLVAVAVLFGSTAPAAAAPKDDERRQVAERVAAQVCDSWPAPSWFPKSLTPKTFCTDIVVETVDPEGDNTALKAACVAALGPAAGPLAGITTLDATCAEWLRGFLKPAQEMFTDQIVPLAEQAQCLSGGGDATSFECWMEQIHVWLKQSITSMWAAFVGVLTQDTQALKIIDIGGGDLSDTQSDFRALVAQVFWLGMSVAFILVLFNFIKSAVRLNFQDAAKSIFGSVAYVLLFPIALGLGIFFIKIGDELAKWATGGVDKNGQSDLDHAAIAMGSWLDYVAGATEKIPGEVHPVYNPGSLSGVLICLALIVAIVMAMITLTLRNVALVVMALMSPIIGAGWAGGQTTRSWSGKFIAAFFAILLAKPILVLFVRLSSTLLKVPSSPKAAQADEAAALIGIVLLLCCCFVPGVIYKISTIMGTNAGSRTGASQTGMAEQSGHSTMSTIQSTKALVRQNGTTSGTRSLTASGPGATTPGGVGSWSGSRGVGAGMGQVASGALIAGTLAAGAVSSATKATASQVGTAGGALDDAEAPHVPQAPYKLGYGGGGSGGQDSGQQQQQRQGEGQQDASARERASISVQRPPMPPNATPSIPSAPPKSISPANEVVIPGEVVADRVKPPPTPPSLPGGPK